MRGRHIVTSDQTTAALLDALGYDASDERTLSAAIERDDERLRERVIAPVEVLSKGASSEKTLIVRLPTGAQPGRCPYRLEIETEDGGRAVTEGYVPPGANGVATLHVDGELSWGYHNVRLSLALPQRDVVASQNRIICPRSCTTVKEVLDKRRCFGVWCNLYSVKSANNWGIGDLSDLRQLAHWAGQQGAAFVGINPLHALRNRGHEISPYRSVSRLFANEIYLDVTAVPEFADCPAAKSLVQSQEYTAELKRLRDAEHVDYAAVARIKRTILALLYQVFTQRQSQQGTNRFVEFRRFLERSGSDLEYYATFRAMDEFFWQQASHPSWHDWPDPYRRSDSPEVRQFQQDHEREIDFHRYVQFELDRQLGSTADSARATMPLGIYADLALGSAASGADVWLYRDLFAPDVSIGSPPDDFASRGQTWGLPPIIPQRLRADGYMYWIRLIRAGLRHAACLRIDHVMGLVRQFWVPAGLSGEHGAYVRYPVHDLLGILALESKRHRAIIVGEDLGTVPSGFQAQLARWGILSSRVLYFERNRNGTFRTSRQYSNRAMVTANTHDQAPLAGYWQDRDLTLREQASAYPDRHEYEAAREGRERERLALTRRLASEGLLLHATAPVDPAQLTRATYTFLARTPSPLLGVSLDDLAGETDPVNLPGVPNERYPNWARKMKTTLEQLMQDAGVQESLDLVRRERSQA
jgi:4-alpha-glucanotransferase